MVKRKRTALEQDSESEIEIEQNNLTKKPKKKRIKSSNKTKKQVKDVQNTNNVTSKKISEKVNTKKINKKAVSNHNQSKSKLSLFKSSSKVSKAKKILQKNNMKKGFMELTRNNDFSELELKCYFLKINFIQKVNVLLINVIVEDVNGNNDKYLTMLSTRNNHVLHHHDKYEINKYYIVSGGHIGVYRGKRQINITAHTKITPCKDVCNAPVYDFMKQQDKLLSDFTKVKTESADKIQTQYLVGWVHKIHEEIHYTQQQSSCIPITLLDVNGVGLKINLWNEFDQKQLQDVKLNDSVVITAWTLKQNGELYSVSNNGVIFYNVNIPVERKQLMLSDNLSDISTESIVINAIPITFKEILNALHGNNSPVSFYKLENIRIVQIERLFRFRDDKGVELNESMSGVIDNNSGESRNFDPLKDSIEYFIKCKIQDINSNIFVYMNGFQVAGESIFNCKAVELYNNYISTQHVNLKLLSDQVSSQGLNVIIKPYINRNQKLYWTLIRVYENWDV